MNKVYVVGLGPGGEEFMTAQARAAMERADVLCGYTAYVALAAASVSRARRPMPPPMTRGAGALPLGAGNGGGRAQRWPLVCSGDAGVYGMAGPLLQLAGEYGGRGRWRWCPASPRRSSGAALLGAPLGHDFCVISLSDLLTPWDAD